MEVGGGGREVEKVGKEKWRENCNFQMVGYCSILEGFAIFCSGNVLGYSSSF